MSDTEKSRDGQVRPDPEVLPRAKRRTFTAEYKLRILQEVDRCSERGQIGALLRREGLYSSHLTKWRRLREEGQLQSLSARRRGSKARRDAETAEIAALRRENERLKSQLQQAELIIDAQKKLAQALQLSLETAEADEASSEPPPKP